MTDPIIDRVNATHTISNAGRTVTAGSAGFQTSETSTEMPAEISCYFEAVLDTVTSTNLMVGIVSANHYNTSGWYVGSQLTSWGYFAVNGTKIHDGVQDTYGAALTTGDVIGLLFYPLSGNVYWCKNGVWQGTDDGGSPVGKAPAYTGIVGPVRPGVSTFASGTIITVRLVADDIPDSSHVPSTAIIGIVPPAALPVLAVLEQPYFFSDPVRKLLDQAYLITDRKISLLDQVYGLRVIVVLVQYYGDVPAVRQFLDQYYGSADLLKRICNQSYGDARKLLQYVDEEWAINAGLLAIMEQRYSLSGGQYLALADQVYNLKDTETIQKLLEQIYVIQPSGITSQRPVVTVTTTTTLTVPSTKLNPYHIEIEIDEDEFAIKGEIHLASEAEFISCVHLETELVIPVNGTEYYLLVEGPWKSRQPGFTEYYIPFASKTILLDSPYADGLEAEFGGDMASAIVQDLANLKSITVIWNMIDWFIPAGGLYANGESPLSVIRRVIGAAGGVLQSSPAGELICRTEYPISLPLWNTSTPDFYLTDTDNFFSVSSKPDIRDGFNRFTISNQDEGTNGLTIEEVSINSTTKHILVYQVPFVSADIINLRTSGGSWVGIVNDGIIEENIIDEQVEIVGGEGNTSKPIYAELSHAYKQTVLGTLTTSESGGITTQILDNSLLDISYTTKYRKFIVTDPNIEDVQFFPEIQ